MWVKDRLSIRGGVRTLYKWVKIGVRKICETSASAACDVSCERLEPTLTVYIEHHKYPEISLVISIL